MAKGSRGGKRAAAIAAKPAPAPTPVAQPGQIINFANGAVDFQSYMKMTNDQKAAVIAQAVTEDTPTFLTDSAFQKFAYSTGMDTPPKVVDDSTFDKLRGQTLYRTVNQAKDSSNAITYSAQDICDSVQYGAYTQYSGTGGSVYGKGLYFANRVSDSADYASSKATTTNGYSRMMRAKINPKAKVVNYNNVSRALDNEMSSGSKLGNALKKINNSDRKSAISIYAVTQGIDVIDAGNGYMNVLNRGALTMGKTSKAVTYYTTSW